MRQELGRCRLGVVLEEVGWSQQDLSDYSAVPKSVISRALSEEPGKKRKISLRDAIAMTDAIYVMTGKLYHPRELYEGTMAPPSRRSEGES